VDKQADKETNSLNCHLVSSRSSGLNIDLDKKYSVDFLRPVTTAEAFEAINWLADLPQRTWPQAAGRSSDIILLRSTAAISAVAMLVGIV